MSTPGNILSMAIRNNRGQKRESAFELFARGYSHPEIAAELGISTRSISRWKKDYENQINSQPKTDMAIAISAQNDVSQRINDLLDLALDSLENILTDEDTKTTDRLRAVSIIGEWSRLGKSNPTDEKAEDRFPVQLGEQVPELSKMTDSELKTLYFEKLQESNG